MNVAFTKDKIVLQEWDDFVINNDIGNHLVLSSWLQSFKSYGFNYEIAIVKEKNKIIGGYGVVLAKVAFFKFYIIPFGPIVLQNNQEVLKFLIDSIAVRAKFLKCCYCQVNYPYSNDTKLNNHIENTIDVKLFSSFKKGNLFKYVYSSNGLNWLELSKYSSTEQVLTDFKSSVRRDIRSSERKNQEIKYLNKEEDIKVAYNLCLLNAKNNNYALREWSSFKETIVTLIKNGNGKFIAAYKDNEIKGAIFIVKAGNYYTYILGGTKKEKPDLLTGHLLQWEAMKLSINEKCDGYNISFGGSDGVKEFKSNFNTTPLHFTDTKYYVVINSIVFKFFLFFEKSVKPHKKVIAKLLSIFKK